MNEYTLEFGTQIQKNIYPRATERERERQFKPFNHLFFLSKEKIKTEFQFDIERTKERSSYG